MNCTRIAPSPTGYLHLGNARTFLANDLLAIQDGWKVVWRFDDLGVSPPPLERIENVTRDLLWLGIHHDAPPLLQSKSIAAHRAALERLIAMSVTYPCTCSRKEIAHAAQAPHAEDGATIYPGTCVGKYASLAEARATGKPTVLRLRMPDRELSCHDMFAGPMRWDLQRVLGDFPLMTSDGVPSYQLATVVDDHAAGVTHVVRGDDLLDSIARQMILYELLGWADAIPTYCHLPLMIGDDGRRLAKRHGPLGLTQLRDAGVAAGRVRAWLGRSLGIDVRSDDVSVDELTAKFSLGNAPRNRVTFSKQDDAWLRGK